MKELKISCPKCGGHIAFPKELAGQPTSCPHCRQAILLGSKPRTTVWITIAAAFVAAVCLSAAVFWQLGKGKGSHTTTAETVATFPKNDALGSSGALTSDDKAVEVLCRELYRCYNERDFARLHQLLSATCRKSLTEADLQPGVGHSYEFRSVESITYPQGPSGSLAVARVRRSADFGFGTQEATREVKCVRENGEWRLFRDGEWMEKILLQFTGPGISEELRTSLVLFCSSDPFRKWPSNVTNTFEEIFKAANGKQDGVFPWRLSFSMVSNYVDGNFIRLVFSIKNNADVVWDPSSVSLELKREGKVVFDGIEFLPALPPQREILRECQILTVGKTVESARFNLDVFYSLGTVKKCLLVEDVPVSIVVPKLTESVRLEELRPSFDLTTSTSGDSMWVARLDYKVRNIGTQPLKKIVLKFSWSSLNGDIIDTSSEYVVGYSDLPLVPQQTRSGFTTCGKGYRNQKTPVRVNIYLEDGERNSLLTPRGIVVR